MPAGAGLPDLSTKNTTTCARFGSKVGGVTAGGTAVTSAAISVITLLLTNATATSFLNVPSTTVIVGMSALVPASGVSRMETQSACDAFTLSTEKFVPDNVPRTAGTPWIAITPLPANGSALWNWLSLKIETAPARVPVP